MRRIKFEEPDDRDWRRWVKKCVEARATDIVAVEAGETLQASDLYKKQKGWFKSVKGPFRGKCAYCEQKIRGSQRGDIEHYRPKAGVRYFDWSYVSRRVEGKIQKHPGYYWLRQSLGNLLFACELCNEINIDEDGKYGKECRFPVRGDYAWNPGEEENEDPLLINPCCEDPADHIELDCESGVFSARDGRGSKGQITIDLLGLNYRDLPKDRKDAYDAAVDAYYAALTLMRFDRMAAFQRLEELRTDDTLPHTSVRRAAIRDCARDCVEFAEAGNDDDA